MADVHYQVGYRESLGGEAGGIDFLAVALTIVEGQQGAEGLLRRQPVGERHGIESAGADQ